MRMPQVEKKHMVYAEDVLWAIMQYPGNNITKCLVRQIIEQVVAEKEIAPYMCMPTASWDDDDGDIYD